MANDNDFVQKRLDTLKDDSFQPNAEHARVRMRMNEAPRGHGWKWAAIPAVAVLAVVLLGHGAASVARAEGGPHPALEHLHFYLMAHWNGLVRLVHHSPLFSKGAPETKPPVLKELASAAATPIRPIAADLELEDSMGKLVRLSDYKGKVVLLNFWATWCGPCKAEVPWFVELQKEYGGDLVVLGVSFDEDGWTSIKPFIEERHVNYPILRARPGMAEMYAKIEQLPTTFLIDRSGRIASKHDVLASKALWEEWVKALL